MCSHRTYCLTFLGILFLQLIKYLFSNDLRHFGVWIISTIRYCIYLVMSAFQSASCPSHFILTIPPWEREDVKENEAPKIETGLTCHN